MIAADKMFLVSEILDKTGFEFPETTKVVNGKTVEKKQVEVAKEIGMTLIKKMYLAKESITQLVELDSGKKAEDLTGQEFMETFIAALRNNGILSFGKSSDK